MTTDENVPLPPLFRIQEGHVFVDPVKQISSEVDINTWMNSTAFLRLMTWIQTLNRAVLNKKISDPCIESENTNKTIHLLETIDAWINEIPPLQNPQRFGNRAFRTWIARLETNAYDLHTTLIPSQWHAAIPELLPYFTGGFGNGTRIDYGSGHELSFSAWLCALEMLGLFGEDHHEALVLRIFVRYLEVVRNLQRVYVLEPAGSHGVWGLDDYQFLPYLWGSAQLRDHPRLKPRSILNRETVDAFAKEYMYFRCIQSINELKRGPFQEHSPMLTDISNVPTWTKVNSGMIKMYVAEVLKKVPIVQHFVFGSFFPFQPTLSPDLSSK